jgi:hypothetical protein
MDPAQVMNNSVFLGDLDVNVYVTSSVGTAFLRPPLCKTADQNHTLVKPECRRMVHMCKLYSV